MSARSTLDLLRQFESQNVTYIEADGSWPIIWERAKGVYVWDERGKRYLDLSAAFGVAAAGHANPRVIGAARRQMGLLLHAMGDVHPHRLKAELARELSSLTFERWTRTKGARSQSETTGKTIFCNSGFEAVEAALKTACLATGKPGVIAFEGAYHGLGYGALNATHREHFRSPFRSQLRQFGRFVPFPDDRSLGSVERQIIQELKTRKIAAILVEPIQARGGINIPPRQFLRMLQKQCANHGALLILDEVYTGFGRTGRWFACEHSQVTPDIICLGKGLTGGFPLSACVGRAEWMDRAWPISTGEAIHTSTFLGHPVGCAMALANIREIANRDLIKQSAQLGAILLSRLQKIGQRKPVNPQIRFTARGQGLLAGLEILKANGASAPNLSLSVIKALLHRGFILLPEGAQANVISFSPPLVISRRQLDRALAALEDVLSETAP